jgi:CrcB protein
MARYVLIALGGAAGAVARYQIAAAIQSRLPFVFPWGTFVVNVTGCFVMGCAMALLTERIGAHQNWRFLVPIGFIGAYTTFSTFEFETYRAVVEGTWFAAGANVLGSVVAGYVALWLGIALGRLV